MIQRPTVSFGSVERGLIQLVLLERFRRAPQVDVEQHAQVVMRKRVRGIGGERTAIRLLGLGELAVLAQQDAELRVGGRVARLYAKCPLERRARVVAALRRADRRARG